MNIEMLKVGELRCNCYILTKNNKVLLIDPGDDSKIILDKIKDKKLVKILLTHNHFDHVGAINDIKKYYDIEVIQKENLEEKEYEVEGFKFEVIFTPGHTKDSVSYLFDNILFSGDFIFKETVGRWDLPGGSYEELINSIEKIKKYNDLIIYPGHGKSTTLKEEKKFNIYFNNGK